MAQLKNIKIVIWLLIMIKIIISCNGIDCNELSKLDRNKQCILIVKDIPNNFTGVHFNLQGISLKTGKDTIYNEENRWFCEYYDYLEKGDTIIKKKGELVFSIHKKDTVLHFNWECEGKVYK